MKLEVGMYVRTPKGIAKIEEITEDRTEIYFNCDTGLSISFIKKDFTQEEMANLYEHSHNITDLIEVGDYVNGLLVTRILEDNETNEKYINLYGSVSEWEEEDIKSIITKEQFESIKYSLEG